MKQDLKLQGDVKSELDFEPSVNATHIRLRREWSR